MNEGAQAHEWERLFGLTEAGGQWVVWENFKDREAELFAGRNAIYLDSSVRDGTEILSREDALAALPKIDKFTKILDDGGAIVTVIHECPYFTVSARSRGFDLPGVFDIPSCYAQGQPST